MDLISADAQDLETQLADMRAEVSAFMAKWNHYRATAELKVAVREDLDLLVKVSERVSRRLGYLTRMEALKGLGRKAVADVG